MSAPPSPGPSYTDAVTAWAEHLRSGGTTPWSAWSPLTAEPAGPQPGSSPMAETTLLPDAIHLELVRRINLAAGPDANDLRGLADRVFATAAPGRGLLDVPLPWPDAPRPFGTPAMDPSGLPEEELVRLTVGVLAHLLPGLQPPAPTAQPSPWPAPWRRRFRLHGAPSTVAAIRSGLLAQGYVETDWRPTHVVIARPVEVMMAEQWAATVRNGGILKWSTTWRRAQAAGHLPAPIDVTRIVERLRDRRREPLHVVVARDADRAAALATAALGARPIDLRSTGDAALSDLLRRLNRLTGLTQGQDRVRDVARTLVALLEEDRDDAVVARRRTAPPAGMPATPPASLPWAREVAAGMAEHLRRDGYAVHGDPDALGPTDHRLPGRIDRERTLELAVTALLRTWHWGGQP
jgi:hypothetical protein